MADDHDPTRDRLPDMFTASHMGKQYLSRRAANIVGTAFITGLIGAVILGFEAGVGWGLAVGGVWTFLMTAGIGVYGSLKNEIGPPP